MTKQNSLNSPQLAKAVKDSKAKSKTTPIEPVKWQINAGFMEQSTRDLLKIYIVD